MLTQLFLWFSRLFRGNTVSELEDFSQPNRYSVYDPIKAPLPITPPTMPPTPSTPVVAPPAAQQGLSFGTPHLAFHAVRVHCDNAGLTLDQKDELCATIWGESGFDNNAKCYNKNGAGIVTSVDVGLCQINSRFHTGPNAPFPSTDYVILHPGQAVDWMIEMYKQGHIDWWVAHLNGRYKQFLGRTM